MIFVTVTIEKSNETHWIYKFIECVTIINYDYWWQFYGVYCWSIHAVSGQKWKIITHPSQNHL